MERRGRPAGLPLFCYMTIRNFVFDLGNVVVKYDPAAMLVPFRLCEADTALFIREVFLGPEWRRYDRGDGEKEKLLYPALARLPAHLQSVCRTLCFDRDLERDHMPPTPGFFSLAQDLCDAGAKLYLLSNAGVDIHRLLGTLPALRLFSGVYISSDHHLLKPDPEIYHSFFNVFGLVPSECVFTDDSPANVAAARAAGMQAVEFSALTDGIGALRETLFSYLEEN